MSSDGNLVSYYRIPAASRPAALERFARKLRDQVAKGKEFHCRITTDTELRRLNREFRGKDYPTDVLSFPAVEAETLGDLAISLPRARAQAAEFGHGVEDELRVLMLHGVLHLTGYDHETDTGRMARAEKRWRKALGLPGGLIERVAS